MSDDHDRVPGCPVWVQAISGDGKTWSVWLTVGDDWDAVGQVGLSESQVRDLIGRLEAAVRGTYPVPLRKREPADPDPVHRWEDDGGVFHG